MGQNGLYSNEPDGVKKKEPETESKQPTKEKQMETVEVKKEGAFISSLKRGNKQIREDRAIAIGDDAELIYKRKIEDIRVRIKKMKSEQENMLDMSPDSAISLKLASSFDAQEYADTDVELGRKIKDEEITLEIAEKRYEYLFGKKI